MKKSVATKRGNKNLFSMLILAPLILMVIYTYHISKNPEDTF